MYIKNSHYFPKKSIFFKKWFMINVRFPLKTVNRDCV